MWQDSVAVTEETFIILKWTNRSPSMAMCAHCHLKFFSPQGIVSGPVEAENYLRNKFIVHECKPRNVYPIQERMAG